MFSLLIRQPAKGNAVINGNLANGVNGVLDMRFVGFLFGHGNFPSLDHKCGAKALFAFALLAAISTGVDVFVNGGRSPFISPLRRVTGSATLYKCKEMIEKFIYQCYNICLQSNNIKYS